MAFGYRLPDFSGGMFAYASLLAGKFPDPVCWCTRTTEVSIICTAASSPAASASMIWSQTPACRQWTKRL